MLTIVVSALNLSKIIATLDGGYGGTPINGLEVRGHGLFSDVDCADQLICALRLFPPHRGLIFDLPSFEILNDYTVSHFLDRCNWTFPFDNSDFYPPQKGTLLALLPKKGCKTNPTDKGTLAGPMFVFHKT